MDGWVRSSQTGPLPTWERKRVEETQSVLGKADALTPSSGPSLYCHPAKLTCLIVLALGVDQILASSWHLRGASCERSVTAWQERRTLSTAAPTDDVQALFQSFSTSRHPAFTETALSKRTFGISSSSFLDSVYLSASRLLEAVCDGSRGQRRGLEVHDFLCLRVVTGCRLYKSNPCLRVLLLREKPLVSWSLVPRPLCRVLIWLTEFPHWLNQGNQMLLSETSPFHNAKLWTVPEGPIIVFRFNRIVFFSGWQKIVIISRHVRGLKKTPSFV